MDSFKVDFCFPVKDLENELLRLTPFDPSVYGASFLEASKDHPELFDYLPSGPYNSVADLEEKWLDVRFTHERGAVLFAVLDKKSQPEQLAGTISLINSSAEALCAEVGFLITLPKYQRTYVTTNSVGLLLQRCLEVPEKGGLGLRRVQWQTSERNNKSFAKAEKLGFKFEGIQRWHRVLPSDKRIAGNGIALREGDPKRTEPGRNSALLAMCWDDWEDGAREKIALMMKPRA